MATFGERFHNLRVERGYTMDALASVLNKRYGTKFNKGTFSKWEKDTQSPEIRVMPILSNFFGVSVDYLIGVTDDYDEDERYVVMFRGALKSVDEDKKKMLIDGVDNMYKMLGHDPEKHET